MLGIYERDVPKGDKFETIQQQVVASQDNQFLVWYRCNESGKLNSYWIEQEKFLEKFKKATG